MKTCFLTQLPIQPNDVITVFFYIPKRQQEQEFRPLLFPFDAIYHDDQHIDISSCYDCTEQAIAEYKWFQDNQELSYDPTHINVWFQQCLQGPISVQVTELDGTVARYPVTIFFCDTNVYTDVVSESIYAQGSSDTTGLYIHTNPFKEFLTNRDWNACLEDLVQETYTTGNLTNQKDNLMFLYAYFQVLLKHPDQSSPSLKSPYRTLENGVQLHLFICLELYDCLYYLRRTIDKPSTGPIVGEKEQAVYKVLCQNIIQKLSK